jgi:hypothetical protein
MLLVLYEVVFAPFLFFVIQAYDRQRMTLDHTPLSLVRALESKSSRVRRTSLCDPCAARGMTTLIAGAGRDGPNRVDDYISQG